MSSRMDISPLFLSGGWSFFPEQLANASDFALSTLAIIAFPGKIRNEGVRARNVQAVASEHRIAGRRVQVEEDARDAFLHELLRKLPDKDPDFGRLAVHAEREEALRLL